MNYERGSGGYGYNATYLGSRNWQLGLPAAQAQKRSARITEVKRPGETLMFADCAISQNDEQSNSYYLETSFAWQPFIVYFGKVFDIYMSPTIHFRHRDRASAAWTDGHVDSRQMAGADDENVWGVMSAEMKLGWFGPIDNSLFDLK